MSRVFNQSRFNVVSSPNVTRHDVSSSVNVGAKASVSNSSGVFSDLPTVLNDYVPESSQENINKIKRSNVVKPRRTLKSQDPAKSPHRTVSKSSKFTEKPRKTEAKSTKFSEKPRNTVNSAPTLMTGVGETWSDTHIKQCYTSASHSKLRELKDEIKAYRNTEKVLKLRSKLYKQCGIVLDDFGQVAVDKAVQADTAEPEKDSEDISNCAISPMNRLLLTLRYYATGSFLVAAGDFSGVSKASASRIISTVSKAIAKLRPRFVTFPENIQQLVQEYYRVARFPRVVGTIDCTHINIKSPGGSNAEYYRDRKGNFSFNVQTVVDANLKILDIVARWPGSSHDQTIFNNSQIKQRCLNNEFGNNFILGDRGYENTNYLLTPLHNPSTPAEHLYNESHIRTRNTVERCYGVWKNRFPVLSKKITLHLSRVQAIIVACAVLHNVAIMSGDEHFDNDIEQIDDQYSSDSGDDTNNSSRNTARNNLIRNYFSSLLE